MLNDDDFRKVLLLFNRSWAGYRKVRKGVKKRLRRHMKDLGCNTVDTYLNIIAAHPEARAKCEQGLLVTISRFFRDRQLWPHLQTRVLPQLASRFPAPIRIWSAGCAGGEEPYSLAISWQALSQPPPLELLATDTNAECLERARKGLYGRSSLKEVPDRTLARYFSSRRGGRQFTIRHQALPPVQWQQHQLLKPPPAGPFQMILLRNNLLTYYQGTTLESAFHQIMETLSPSGYLVIGSHERFPETNTTLTRDPQCPWLYQKR